MAKSPAVADVNQVLDAELAAGNAYREYYAAKGWFTCDALCTAKYAEYKRLDEERKGLERALGEVQADANAELGLFSTQAVMAVRDRFWSGLSFGKEGAARSTKYDAMFMAFRSLGRDESIVSFLLELLVRFLINLVIFIFVALIGFLWSVWDIILAYRPNPASALLFFAMCCLMSWSLFLSLLLGIAASVTAATLGVTAATRLSLQNREAERQRQAQQVHYD